MQKFVEKLYNQPVQRPENNWQPAITQGPSFGKGLSKAEFIVGLLIILALSAITHGSLAFFWNKFSRAEVFFAECSRAMLVSGNFITPLYHNQPFFDKPIFVYWLIIAMFKTFGITHFAARIPSIIASVLTILSTAIAGSFLCGRRTGLAAAAMLASAFMYLSFSSLCMSDIFLVLFDTLSLMFIFAGIQFTRHRDLNWWLAAVSMGFGFLTKGPVGVVLPVAASIIYLALTKKLSLLKGNHFIAAIVTIGIIASPWFYAAYLANGQEALVHFFIQENLQRFAGTTYDVHKPFWYTIFSFFLGFAPWSILLPSVALAFWKSLCEFGMRITNSVKVTDDLNYEASQVAQQRLSFGSLSFLPMELSAELFLWIWVFIVVGFFCFSRGKCDYYTLPAYPAAAILVAQYVGHYFNKYWISTLIVALAIGVSVITFSVIFLPQVNHLVPVNKYAAAIKNGPDNLCVGIDSSLSSWADEILFQSGKDPACLADEQQIKGFVTQRQPFILLMPESKYKQLEEKFGHKRKREWHVLARDQVATHSLTPGYFISRGGHLEDAEPLIMATNVQEQK